MSIKTNAIELELLDKFGIDGDVAQKYQVLCLPETVEYFREGSDLVDSTEAITLSKLFKGENVACANSYDLGLDAKISERRGIDIYVGCIWIRDHAAVPAVVAILSRFLGDKIQGWRKGSEKDKVHADIRITDEKISAEIKFNGDTETFIKMIQGIKDE